MFLQVSVCPQGRGRAWLWGRACIIAGGMHGGGGVHGGRGCVWWWGACQVAGGMCSGGGMHVGRGACVVAGGMCGCRGHACWGACVVAGGMHGIRRDTVNEQAVCILLECILVIILFIVCQFVTWPSTKLAPVCFNRFMIASGSSHFWFWLNVRKISGCHRVWDFHKSSRTFMEFSGFSEFVESDKSI